MKKILMAVLLLAGFFTFAQDYRPGKVSRAELEQKFHPADTAAPAAILYKKGQTYFMLDLDGYWSMVTEVEYRIKIYKKEGLNYATDKLTYYTGGKTVKAFYSDAYTYNLVDGKVEKTKLKGDGEFKEDVEENYRQRIITMPNVKEGSVIEYKYTIATPYFTVFRDWYFQHEIPAGHVSYEIAIPLYFNYNRFLSGYIEVSQSEPKVRLGAGGRFNESAVTFTAKNVKAIKDEGYTNNIKNYTSILSHELASTHFPSGKEDYATDWESVTKRIYDDEDFGRELEYSSYFKEDLPAVIASASSRADKASAVFAYLQGRMNWNGETSYYCEAGVKKAYEDKVGNSAEINLMLTAMLREAGVPAHPVLVSTRSNGVALFPNRAAYNYVVAGVEEGKNIMLLDATSKHTAMGILPIRALNWEGRMIRKDGTSVEVDLMPNANSRDMVSITAAISPEGTIAGKAREQHYDHHAYIFREKYAGMAEESYVQKMEQRYKSTEVSDYKVEDSKGNAGAVTETYSFTHSGSIEVTCNKMYLTPMLFFAGSQNPFSKETREYPIDFGFPYQQRYVFALTIPEGYEVEYLPKGVALKMEENIGAFRYNISAKDNTIQLGISLDINFANVSQDYYSTLRDFFIKMTDKQNEKIVFKKK
ncbi:DUF3857 and transglutaminase domain-containing protein [uncultured Flavobacterium sp.]|uniref:DUF3857 and transglutaminase domain-containing protein n=1 Tax=uncultured Flavobacterium sp. TaxID=165435 RepID=UPI0025D45F07|nr:DUF3857 and transglutaminase domain-containing protein [uncultured Flavobacterium sp.]